MSKYTTVHDVQDIANIYHECNNWSMNFWNFTDQCYMKLHYLTDGFDKDHERVAWFVASKVCKNTHRLDQLSHLLGWKRWLKQTFDECNDDYKEKMAWENAKIIVINAHNLKHMKIAFSGSCRPDKVITYTIDYIDPRYRAWKRWLFWKIHHIKYKLSKWRITKN